MVKQQPEQQAPPVQRLRLQYTKRGRARFLSSRDFGRAFERALRRARVPMAYSSGFTPHPRISYANAAPTSAASEAEFLEIGLAELCDPERVRAALDEALPDGLDIVRVAEASGGSLADQLTASEWLVELGPVEAGVLESAIADLLGRDEATTTRMTKSGPRTFDVRAAIESIAVSGDGELTIVIHHMVPLVRPDDVVAVLRALRPELIGERPLLLTRRTQGRLVEGRIVHPFD